MMNIKNLGKEYSSNGRVLHNKVEVVSSNLIIPSYNN